MYNRSGDGVGCVEIKVGTNAAQLTNVIVAEKVRFSSKTKPRLRAKWLVFKEIFCSLTSCCWTPMKKYSVFEDLRINRLEVIQEKICCRAPRRYVMLEFASKG